MCVPPSPCSANLFTWKHFFAYLCWWKSIATDPLNCVPFICACVCVCVSPIRRHRSAVRHFHAIGHHFHNTDKLTANNGHAFGTVDMDLGICTHAVFDMPRFLPDRAKNAHRRKLTLTKDCVHPVMLRQLEMIPGPGATKPAAHHQMKTITFIKCIRRRMQLCCLHNESGREKNAHR